MNTFKIHIVDDEVSIREGLANALKHRYKVSTFPDAESFLDAMRQELPDLVLLDLGLPGMSGIDALREMKTFSQEILVIVITAFEDVKSVVSAMRHGAYDYIVKPLEMSTMDVNIRNALESIRLKKEVRDLQEKYLRDNLPCFIGDSNTIRDVMELVSTLAKSPDTPIMILGETGTGKEMIASAIHYRSPNFRGALVSVNCAAIPRELIESELFGYEKGAFSGASTAGKKGLVEQAAGGTLFLDEVGDLGMEAQAKLLRFLEDGEFYRVGGTRKYHVNTRIVSATNKDLETLIGKGVFREDLYYRLAVVKVNMPSLNDRPDDIIPIARHFLVEYNRKFGKEFTGIAQDAEHALKTYRWKGNVRELKNLMERAALIGKGKEIALDDLGFRFEMQAGVTEKAEGDFRIPPLPPEGIDFEKVRDMVESYYIREALERTGGNESRAAQLLNLNHHTFRYRKKKLEI